MTVRVVPHDPFWADMFETEAHILSDGLGPVAVAVFHIGSTSIAGISAKPVIDILLETASHRGLDARNAIMVDIGYEVMGEFGIAGRRYYRKNDAAGTRTHQIHAFETGSCDLLRHLAFRDYLRTHPEDARRYSDLKIALATSHPTNIEAYMDGKNPLIKELEQRALRWQNTTG